MSVEKKNFISQYKKGLPQILKKNLITLRLNTERPETTEIGANFVSMKEQEISKRISFILKSKNN